MKHPPRRKLLDPRSPIALLAAGALAVFGAAVVIATAASNATTTQPVAAITLPVGTVQPSTPAGVIGYHISGRGAFLASADGTPLGNTTIEALRDGGPIDARQEAAASPDGRWETKPRQMRLERACWREVRPARPSP